MSPSKVAAARPLRPVRKTLVAPILPEPIVRMSVVPASRVRISPNGIEPSRYPNASASSQMIACIVGGASHVFVDRAPRHDRSHHPTLQPRLVERRVLALGFELSAIEHPGHVEI